MYTMIYFLSHRVSNLLPAKRILFLPTICTTETEQELAEKSGPRRAPVVITRFSSQLVGGCMWSGSQKPQAGNKLQDPIYNRCASTKTRPDQSEPNGPQLWLSADVSPQCNAKNYAQRWKLNMQMKHTVYEAWFVNCVCGPNFLYFPTPTCLYVTPYPPQLL